MVQIIDPAQMRANFHPNSIAIDEHTAYDSDTFESAVKAYATLSDSYARFKANRGDLGALESMAKLFFPHRESILHAAHPKSVLDLAEAEAGFAGRALAKYTDANNLVSRLNTKQLNALVLSLANPEENRIYIRDREGENARKAELVRQEYFIEAGEPEKLIESLDSALEGAPEHHMRFYEANKNNAEYMGIALRVYSSVVRQEYTKTFGDIQGNRASLNPLKLLQFYNANLGIAKAEAASQTNAQNNLRILHGKVTPLNLRVAHLLAIGDIPEAAQRTQRTQRRRAA